MQFVITFTSAALIRNRKLQKFLGASRPANHETDGSCDLSDLTYNSLLQNLTECNYFDISNLVLSGRNLIGNSSKTLTLVHVNLRSINNFQNFDAFEEFLTNLSFSPRHRVCIPNQAKKRAFD